jgi:DNA-binding XRE family transcriptional regulator
LIVITTPLLYLQYLFEPEVSLDVSVPKLAKATKENDKAVTKQPSLSIKILQIFIVAFKPWPVNPWPPVAWHCEPVFNTLQPMQTLEHPITLEAIRSTIAVNLRRYRAERGIAQERLALIAGVDRTMVSKIERELTNPSIETLLKLANVLGVTVSALLANDQGTQDEKRLS